MVPNEGCPVSGAEETGNRTRGSVFSVWKQQELVRATTTTTHPFQGNRSIRRHTRDKVHAPCVWFLNNIGNHTALVGFGSGIRSTRRGRTARLFEPRQGGTAAAGTKSHDFVPHGRRKTGSMHKGRQPIETEFVGHEIVVSSSLLVTSAFFGQTKHFGQTRQGSTHFNSLETINVRHFMLYHFHLINC